MGMEKTGTVRLEFDPELNKLSGDKELRDGLSVVVQVGNTLWVTNDETITLERLSLQKSEDGNKHVYGDHKQFRLIEYLPLPVPPDDKKKKIEEADLEGLDYKDGYLWLVGSHSLKRKKADDEDSEKDNIKNLANVSSDGNRFLLARIPIVEEGGTYVLKKEVEQEGEKRTAALLDCTATGSRLTEVIECDKHLKKFLSVPGKDNGFDIEGLARVGDRVFVGLRGPVLRGWAVILELEPEVSKEDSSKLKLKVIDPDDGSIYRKHFLKLDGLGIRDMFAQGDDLLILAGPTMELDGPVTVYRWKGGARPENESVVFPDEVPEVGAIPFGVEEDKGKDHAEGMTLFSAQGHQSASVLVVYDSASKGRRPKGEATMVADIFSLPE
ncbi:MAG TPA: DUF3616 domain-containing protein [Blastocatellia bacterium]|nr:DUF3616 domain-containing protein [Blastocatellia bacterium]